MPTEQQQADASKLWIDEWFAGCDNISWMELVKIQANVLLPVLRSLRKEFGAERANRLVTDALRGWSREIDQKVGAQLAGSPARSSKPCLLHGCRKSVQMSTSNLFGRQPNTGTLTSRGAAMPTSFGAWASPSSARFCYVSRTSM